jgi:hypothetical protein
MAIRHRHAPGLVSFDRIPQLRDVIPCAEFLESNPGRLQLGTHQVEDGVGSDAGRAQSIELVVNEIAHDNTPVLSR